MPIYSCERDCHYKLISAIMEENSSYILEDVYTGIQRMAPTNNMYRHLQLFDLKILLGSQVQ